MTLQIVSINTRGLRDPIKRRSIFNYYKARGNAICIQESHSIEEDEVIWKSEWPGKIYFSHGTSAARGVCILLAKDIEFRVVNIDKDQDGRMIICELENIDDPTKRVTLCNIYAPNKDNPSFFVSMAERAMQMSSEQVFVGDYNLVMNVDMDKKGVGLGQNKSKSREVIDKLCEELMLTEIWRDLNPNEKLYTWMRVKPQFTASRLDYALISESLAFKVGNCMYIPGVLTDHMGFYVSLNITGTERGRGYWKFNNKLLHDTEYVSDMNKLLDQKLKESEYMNPHEKWEFLKQNIIKFSKNYAKNINIEKELIISQLSEKILELEHKVSNNYDANTWKILSNSKAEIDELLTEKSKGIIFRTKSRYYELGEKNTKYFYNLEKKRYNARVCSQIIKDNGETIENQDEILKEQKAFYEKLYKSDDNIKFSLINTTGLKVPEHLRKCQQLPFTKEEMALALKKLKSNKTPGHDGLSPEFYKMFYKILGDSMYEMIQYSFESGHLPNSLKLAIINLIKKSGKDCRKLAHLRPISLLSADYKVVEKMIGNRLETALEHIIHADQKGFQAGKNIATNIRRVFDLIQYAEQNDLEALILSLDFKKCFDMI